MSAEVEGQNRLRSAGDAAQGHGHHQHKALGDGGAGDHPVSQLRAAVALQNRVHGDDHDAVHADDEKGRDAGDQDTRHEAAVISAKRNGDGHLPAEQKRQHIGAAGQLGQDGRQRRAPDAHVHQEDKHRVQHDVQRRSQHHGHHTLFGKALADDKLVHAQSQQIEHRAPEVDGEVALGVGVGDGAAAEGQQHGPPQGEGRRHQRHGADTKQQKTVGKDAPGLLHLPRAHADEGRAADADEGGEGADHGHDGAADPHTRQGQVPHHRDVADVDAVHDAVQHADELGQHTGDGDTPDQGFDRVRPQVIFQFHVEKASNMSK